LQGSGCLYKISISCSLHQRSSELVNQSYLIISSHFIERRDLEIPWKVAHSTLRVTPRSESKHFPPPPPKNTNHFYSQTSTKPNPLKPPRSRAMVCNSLTPACFLSWLPRKTRQEEVGVSTTPRISNKVKHIPETPRTLGPSPPRASGLLGRLTLYQLQFPPCIETAAPRWLCPVVQTSEFRLGIGL